ARSHRDLAHRLHAARHGRVDHAAGDQPVRQGERLLRGPALRVDGRARHAAVQPGREPGGTGHVARLRADLVDAAADHLADERRVDTGPGDQGGQHVAEQVRRQVAGEAALALGDRRTYGLRDDDLGHDPPSTRAYYLKIA